LMIVLSGHLTFSRVLDFNSTILQSLDESIHLLD
jgi:hypothetical protein